MAKLGKAFQGMPGLIGGAFPGMPGATASRSADAAAEEEEEEEESDEPVTLMSAATSGNLEAMKRLIAEGVLLFPQRRVHMSICL